MGRAQKAATAEELWQGYEEDGEPITDLGVTLHRAAHGALHGAAHLWIWRVKNGDIQVLLQKRASSSKTWPDHFDVSAAGHQNFNEAPLAAALRETKEELGITVDPAAVQLLFVHRQELRYVPENIDENEIQWVYGYDVTGTPHFTLASSEVASILWLSLDELSQLIAGKIAGMRIVPHDEVYFAELLREMLEHEQ